MIKKEKKYYRPLPDPLNESTESNFLDKVVTHLLKDTKYDKQSDMIVSPIPIEGRAIRSSLNFTIYHKFLWDLKDYLTKIYGLNEEEADEVWGKYQRKLRIYNAYDNAYSLRDDIISESIDKQEKYLHYIITTLLNETIIDKENEEVHLPWGMMYVNVISNFAGIDKDLHNPAEDLTGNMAGGFWNMMMDIYGLKQDEVERVWRIYGPTLSKKMHVAWFDDWIELMSRI